MNSFYVIGAVVAAALLGLFGGCITKCRGVVMTGQSILLMLVFFVVFAVFSLSTR